MTENDRYPGDDDHGDRPDYADTVRALFGRVAAGSTPTIGFTGDTLARVGRSNRRRIRAATVIGGAVSVTAVAVAVPLALGGGGTGAGAGTTTIGPGTRAAATTPATPPTSAAHATTPAPATPATSAPDASQKPPGAESGLSETDRRRASASFRLMVKGLDPAARHLSIGDADLNGGFGGMDVNGEPADLSISATWWSDGHPRQMIDPHDSTPYVDVQLDLTSPTALDQLGGWGRIVQDGTAVRWQHRDSKRLPDGTKVNWVWTTTPIGTEMMAQHILSDGRQIVISVTDGSGDPTIGTPNAAKPSTPFPFTTEQLVAVVSDPALTPPTFQPAG